MSATFAAVVKLVRPKQWIKNFFVLAPLVFSRELFLAEPLLWAIRAFLGFCFAASAVYVMNDIADRDSDRAHPEKKNRPLASGTVSIPQSLILMVLLLAITIALVWELNNRYQLFLGTYFLLNLAYSIKLKEVVLLDVFIIAAGFMLRVLAGAYAINVQVSSWIVLCTLFISLFLGFAKRRGEILLVQDSNATSERKVLHSYRVEFIDQMLTIAAAATVISYALYTVSPRTLELFGTDKMIYTTLFVLYGLFRYLYLIHMTKSTENPTNAVTSDVPTLVIGFLWLLSCVILIYWNKSLSFILQ